MIRAFFSRRLHALILVASAITLTTAVCVAQTAQATTSLYTNPRSGPDDPRVGLKGGLYDAKAASSGLERVATLPKTGVFAPNLAAIAESETRSQAATAGGAPIPARGVTIPYGPNNSDLAFGGKYAFEGNFSGINIYDISTPDKIKLVTSIVCPGGQGDVSVYGHLVFMSDEAANGRTDCGTQGIPLPLGYTPPARRGPEGTGRTSSAGAVNAPAGAVGSEGGAESAAAAQAVRQQQPASPDRFRGVRIFDISDINSPRQVAAVQTCRGSHTHTVVVDPKDKDDVYIYVAGSSGVRPSAELAGCSGGDAATDPNTALYTIVVIKVPLAHPDQAIVVNSPRIFSDPKTGAIDALVVGGSHGEHTERITAIRGCHDITVYSEIGLAAGACSGNGILLNISDPVHPIRIEAKADSNFAFWHSATFNNDGTKVLFSDEWGGGNAPRCRFSDPMNWGADSIFNLSNGKLTQASYYKMPVPESELKNCVAHNGSLIPIPGRDILVQAWYQGGVSIVDFTDSAHPYEVGYYDEGPVSDKQYAIGGDWSAYWYNGYIYGSEIARGIDVWKLTPNKYLTQNEINAAAQLHVDEFNPQNQQKIVWPANFITARAYIDQLARNNVLTALRLKAINIAIDKAETSKRGKKEVAQLHALAAGLEKDQSSPQSVADIYRLHQLIQILKQ
jgi:hypothetical protein